jgi:hypothetical protein
MTANRLPKAVLLVPLLGVVGLLTFAPGSRFGDGTPVFFRLIGVDRIAGVALECIALPVLVVSGVVGIGGLFLGMALWESDAGGERVDGGA